MKLIIDVPEKVYQNAREDMLFGSELITNAIKNGTPIEQEPCEDCISRAFLIDRILEKVKTRRSTIEICNKLIPLIKDLPSVQPKPKTEWIPIKTRPMTEEEAEHYSEYTDMRIADTYTILDCPLPDDGQEVLVSWGGNVVVDVFVRDDVDCFFEGVDIDEVDAWMSLPEPYKEG